MNDPSSLKTPRDGSGLYNMLEALTGGNLDFELPLAALQEVTKHVATISRKAAPKLIQQKRAFVRGWHEENRKLNQPGGGGLRTRSRQRLTQRLTAARLTPPRQVRAGAEQPGRPGGGAGGQHGRGAGEG